MAQTIATTSRPAYRAYQILYIGFIVAPFLAGFAKFTHFLTNWDQYLAPVVAGLLEHYEAVAQAYLRGQDDHSFNPVRKEEPCYATSRICAATQYARPTG
jgi:hypothetical protein